jgi:hypothetical protein
VTALTQGYHCSVLALPISTLDEYLQACGAVAQLQVSCTEVPYGWQVKRWADQSCLTPLLE